MRCGWWRITLLRIRRVSDCTKIELQKPDYLVGQNNLHVRVLVFEPLWSYLKNRVAQHNVPGTSEFAVARAKEVIQLEWERVPIEDIKHTKGVTIFMDSLIYHPPVSNLI